MQSFLLQDWVTVGTDGGAAGVVQASGGWVDLGFASEVVFFLELARRTTLSPQNMIYETAPLRDASTFRALGTPLSITSAGATPTVSRFALYDNPAQPVSRWVRWRTVSQDTGVSWNITFRITMMAYAR